MVRTRVVESREERWRKNEEQEESKEKKKEGEYLKNQLEDLNFFFNTPIGILMYHKYRNNP